MASSEKAFRFGARSKIEAVSFSSFRKYGLELLPGGGAEIPPVIVTVTNKGSAKSFVTFFGEIQYVKAEFFDDMLKPLGRPNPLIRIRCDVKSVRNAEPHTLDEARDSLRVSEQSIRQGETKEFMDWFNTMDAAQLASVRKGELVMMAVGCIWSQDEVGEEERRRFCAYVDPAWIKRSRNLGAGLEWTPCYDNNWSEGQAGPGAKPPS